MPFVKDKYRGTPLYHQVFGELITAARYRGTVTYQELAQMMGLPLKGSHMGSAIGHILGEISEDEHTQGRPLLSAVAVGVSGEPGDGFFALAKDLGIEVPEPKAERRVCWEKELAAVYETWKLALRESK